MKPIEAKRGDVLMFNGSRHNDAPMDRFVIVVGVYSDIDGPYSLEFSILIGRQLHHSVGYRCFENWWNADLT